MREVSIREVRAMLPRLEEELAAGEEIVVTRRGEPIARLSPMRRPKVVVSTADLRARIPPLDVPSEVLIRQERDER